MIVVLKAEHTLDVTNGGFLCRFPFASLCRRYVSCCFQDAADVLVLGSVVGLLRNMTARSIYGFATAQQYMRALSQLQ